MSHVLVSLFIAAMTTVQPRTIRKEQQRCHAMVEQQGLSRNCTQKTVQTKDNKNT